jgi:CRISPR-associated protein Cas2
MQGYGEWMQLSVFQCRLTRMRVLRLEEALHKIVNHDEDHILFVDLGPADMVKPKVQSIGKPFAPVEHKAVIV